MMTAPRIPFLVLLLWIAGLCAAGQFAKIAVPFAEFRALYPGAGGNVGWLLSVISLLGALFGAFAGALVGVTGPVRMLVGGLLAGGVISLLQSGIPGFSVMLASRVVEGLAHLAIVVAAPTLIARITPDRWRGASMALWSTFFGVAFALVAWAGLPLVHRAGLGALFAVHGAVMLGVGVVAAVALRGTGGPEEPEETDGLAAIRAIPGRLVAACRSPFIAAPGASWLFYTVIFVAVMAILPERLPDGVRAPVTAAMPLLSTGMALIGVPLLMRGIGASAIVIGGFACSMVAVLVFGQVSLAAMCLVLFTTMGLVQGAGFAAVPELNRTGDAQALSYGLMAQTGNIGNLAGTPLLLAVLDHGGERALYLAIAAIYGAAVVVLVTLARMRRRSGLQPQAHL